MNRKQKIIISVTGIFIVLLILVGLTYAYFLTRIQGNTNTKSISVTTADLKLTYADGNGTITAEKIQPGTTIDTKTFTVKNEGNATVNNYAVYLEELVNTLSRTSDMVYTLTCTSSVENKTCNGKTETSFPTQNGMLVTNNIDVKETQSYELKVEYKEMNVDQSEDMNKTISAKVQIYNLSDIVDITGTVTNASDGDYVEMQSTPKTSQIRNNIYFIPAVEPGTHTLYVKDSKGTVKGSKQITINKGKEAKVSGDTITVTNDSQTISINITNISSTLTTDIGDVKDYSPFSDGTLASAIYANAKKTNQYSDIINENKKIEKLDKSIMYVSEDKYNYYMTYGDNYKLDESSEIFTLTNVSRCKYSDSDCQDKLVGKYIISNNFDAVAQSSNSNSGINSKFVLYKIKKIGLIERESDTNDGHFDTSIADNYITYGTGYNMVDDTVTLTNTTTCKFSDCSNDLVGKYFFGTASFKTTKDEAEKFTSSSFSKLYKVKSIEWDGDSPYASWNYYYYSKSIYLDKYSYTLENKSTLIQKNDNYGVSYMFRGPAKNNYVNFANKCWRIVRIAGDNSIRLILANGNGVCSSSTMSGVIGTGDYGYTTVSSGDYTSNDLGDYENSANSTSSMKSKFDNYFSNFSNTDISKLKKDESCIGDDGKLYDKNDEILNATKESILSSSVWNDSSQFVSVGIHYKYRKNLDTLICNGSKTSQSYIYPISASEVRLSGELISYLNDDVSLKTNEFVATSTLFGLQADVCGLGHGETLYSIDYNGVLFDGTSCGNKRLPEEQMLITVRSTYLLRPMISLKPNIELASGDGTLENPYTVK